MWDDTVERPALQQAVAGACKVRLVLSLAIC
jgi:hypothetical protein